MIEGQPDFVFNQKFKKTREKKYIKLTPLVLIVSRSKSFNVTNEESPNKSSKKVKSSKSYSFIKKLTGQTTKKPRKSLKSEISDTLSSSCRKTKRETPEIPIENSYKKMFESDKTFEREIMHDNEFSKNYETGQPPESSLPIDADQALDTNLRQETEPRENPATYETLTNFPKSVHPDNFPENLNNSSSNQVNANPNFINTSAVGNFEETQNISTSNFNYESIRLNQETRSIDSISIDYENLAYKALHKNNNNNNKQNELDTSKLHLDPNKPAPSKKNTPTAQRSIKRRLSSRNSLRQGSCNSRNTKRKSLSESSLNYEAFYPENGMNSFIEPASGNYKGTPHVIRYLFIKNTTSSTPLSFDPYGSLSRSHGNLSSTNNFQTIKNENLNSKPMTPVCPSTVGSHSNSEAIPICETPIDAIYEEKIVAFGEPLEINQSLTEQKSLEITNVSQTFNHNGMKSNLSDFSDATSNQINTPRQIQDDDEMKLHGDSSHLNNNLPHNISIQTSYFGENTHLGASSLFGTNMQMQKIQSSDAKNWRTKVDNEVKNNFMSLDLGGLNKKQQHNFLRNKNLLEQMSFKNSNPLMNRVVTCSLTQVTDTNFKPPLAPVNGSQLTIASGGIFRQDSHLSPGSESPNINSKKDHSISHFSCTNPKSSSLQKETSSQDKSFEYTPTTVRENILKFENINSNKNIYIANKLKPSLLEDSRFSQDQKTENDYLPNFSSNIEKKFYFGDVECILEDEELESLRVSLGEKFGRQKNAKSHLF